MGERTFPRTREDTSLDTASPVPGPQCMQHGDCVVLHHAILALDDLLDLARPPLHSLPCSLPAGAWR